MTEPVLESLMHRALASLLALSIASLTPVAVRAAPVEAPTTEPAAAEAPTADPPASDIPDEAAIRSALDDGDLTTARELAQARSAADPSAENLVLEAQVWLALGDYEQARRAYTDAREALPEDRSDERQHIDEQLEAIEAASRGTRADEPASTERERIDRERAERLAALAPKPPPPEVIDKPKPVPITKKWYFWVTLGAIVASAGAIVGIATASAVDERKAQDAAAAAAAAAARRPMPVPVGGVMLRF